MIMEITPVSVAMFFLYTLVALLAALVARIGVGTMGEKAKNKAVEAVTLMVADAVKDSREARTELITERDKRARLEGKVDAIMNQATEEKRRSDLAYKQVAKQEQQITRLSSEVRELTSEIQAIRDRLTQAETEKKALEAEKSKLQNELNTQSEDYRKLMASVQERIDKAVAEVKEELRIQYEKLIGELETKIGERDEEIKSLQALLKEKESDEKSTAPSSAIAADTVPDSTDTGTGSNGSPSADSGSADSPSGGSSSGGSPSA